MPCPSRVAVQETQELTLAPAAGSGIGKVVAAELIARDVGKKIASALERGLEATARRWIQTGKGEGYFEDSPDMRSQLQAAALILAHMEGEPVKRIIHQHLGAGGAFDLKSALQESPELADMLRNELTKAEWRKSGRGAKKAQPADAIEVPE